MASLGKLTMVDSPGKWTEAIARIRDSGASVVAVDTETAYWELDSEFEMTSLIQIAFREGENLHCCIFDVLRKPLMAELLQPLFSDPTIVKVGHNFSYDLRLLAKTFGLTLINNWCTMTAGKRAKRRENSLEAMSKDLLGVAMEKGDQNSDWSRRPLHIHQRNYAAKDAAITLLLYEHCKAQGWDGQTVYVPNLAKQQIIPGFMDSPVADLRRRLCRVIVSGELGKRFIDTAYGTVNAEDHARSVAKTLKSIEKGTFISEEKGLDVFSLCVLPVSIEDVVFGAERLLKKLEGENGRGELSQKEEDYAQVITEVSMDRE